MQSRAVNAQRLQKNASEAGGYGEHQKGIAMCDRGYALFPTFERAGYAIWCGAAGGLKPDIVSTNHLVRQHERSVVPAR